MSARFLSQFRDIASDRQQIGITETEQRGLSLLLCAPARARRGPPRAEPLAVSLPSPRRANITCGAPAGAQPRPTGLLWGSALGAAGAAARRGRQHAGSDPRHSLRQWRPARPVPPWGPLSAPRRSPERLGTHRLPPPGGPQDCFSDADSAPPGIDTAPDRRRQGSPLWAASARRAGTADLHATAARRGGCTPRGSSRVAAGNAPPVGSPPSAGNRLAPPQPRTTSTQQPGRDAPPRRATATRRRVKPSLLLFDVRRWAAAADEAAASAPGPCSAALSPPCPPRWPSRGSDGPGGTAAATKGLCGAVRADASTARLQFDAKTAGQPPSGPSTESPAFFRRTLRRKKPGAPNFDQNPESGARIDQKMPLWGPESTRKRPLELSGTAACQAARLDAKMLSPGPFGGLGR